MNSLIIKWDTRCKEFMIYPGEFNPENSPLPIGEYGSLMINEDSNPSFELVNLFIIRAIFHRSLFEYNESIDYFMKALNLSPQNPSFLLEIGTTYYLWDNLSKAIYYWERAADNAVNNSDIEGKAYFNIACAESKLGNMDKVLSMLKLALENNINFNDIINDPDLAEFRQDGHFKELKTFYE